MSEREWAAVAAVLRDGGVAAVPTDTVWGLVTLATNATGVERIYEIKGRDRSLELPLLVPVGFPVEHVVDMTVAARALAGAHWPGAVTLVLRCVEPRSEMVIPLRGDTLAVRIPAHAGLQSLLSMTGPLASTSANLHGSPPARSAPDVRAQFGSAVDRVAAIPGSVGGAPSTIVDCTGDTARVLRHGSVEVATEPAPNPSRSSQPDGPPPVVA